MSDHIAKLDLPKMRSGIAFGGKFWVSLLLLVCSVLVAVPVVDLASLLYFLILVVPLASAGLFFFLVPVQLRVNGSSVAYRRWFRWNRFPKEDLLSARMFFLAFGAADISGQSRRLIFFLEPENRPIVGLPQKEGAREASRSDLAVILGEQRQAVKDIVLGALGTILALFVNLSHPLTIAAYGPRRIGAPWLNAMYLFEDHHTHLIALVAIVSLVILIRARHWKGAERGIASILIGIAAAGLLVQR